jgi:hypothetical protein
MRAAARELVEVRGHLGARLLEVIEHRVERARDVADLVPARASDPRRDVAAADPLGGVLDRPDRAHEAAREQPRRQQREHERHCAGEREVLARVAQRLALGAEVRGDAQLESG